MRVGINARALSKPNPAGVSRYTRKLVDALAREERGSDATFVLFGVDAVPEGLAAHDNVESTGVPVPAHSGLRAHRWEQLELPRAIGRVDVDVFHTPAGQPPVLARVPLVTTIHDISPVVHPEWFSRSYAALYRVLTPLAVRASDRIVTVSAFARDEIVDRYPRAAGKTVAVHNGLTPPSPDGPTVDGVRSGEFLLSVGSMNPRKNLRRLVEAYGRYREHAADPASLALVGPTKSVFADASIEPGEGVETLGFVSDEELGWLYHNAAAFVFPSLYEGFGLPILEAMSAGTPVVTADRGAMAEVAGDAACLVDPTDSDAIADGIERTLCDADARERLARRGRERAAVFTWERAARRTAEAYRSVARESSR
ncbi:glycosyltransferase family 4 protein [Halegenticoccus tardaugens]|uniref:glycosyltransferase family 4 protein n=1 Tax=Halegenticoccus tardaugens TaxID=2071624 RepID=UPI00100C109A|nr:glycosyltransferase family 1 protein [Halegenticoccus tardaugens]